MSQIVRKIRYVSGLLGVFAGALVVAAAALPFLVDQEAVQASLVRSLSAWSGGPVAISGPLRITSFANLTVEASGVRLQTAPRLAPLSRAEAKSVAAAVRLSSLLRGRIEFKSVTLDSPQFVFRRASPAANPSLSGFETVSVISALAAKNTFADIEFVNPAFFYADGGRKPFRRLELERVRLGIAAPPSLSPALVALSVKGQGVRAYFRGECDASDGAARGALRLDVSLDNAAAKAMLGSLAPWETADTVVVSGDVTWSRERIALDRATIAFGDHGAAGSVALNLQGRRALFEGTLAYDTLDLTPAWNANAEAAGKGEALPLAALPFAGRGHDRAIDLDMRLSAERFRAGPFETGPLALALTAMKDRLAVDVAEVALFGGKATARLDVDPSQPVALSMNGSGSQLDPRAIAEALGLPHGVSGPVTVQLDMTMPLTGKAPLQDLEAAAGSLSARFPAGGALEGDMARVLSAALVHRDLDWGLGGASMPFAAARIDGTFRQGGIDLKIDGESGDKSIGGQLRIAFPGAAVSGSLSARQTADAPELPPLSGADAGEKSSVHLVLSGTAESVVFSPLAEPIVPN